jgi:hypothetical protein
MGMKKGQVSIFIIVAIAILAAIVIFFFLKGEMGDVQSTEWETVESIILDCADDVTQDSLELIGVQGGFYNEPPYYYFDMEWAYIPYYYYEGELLMPENSVIEGELSDYVDDNLVGCLESFEIEGYEITHSEPSTKVSIEEEQVGFDIDMIVNIKKGEMTSQLNLAEFPANKPSALGKILDVAEYITDSHLEPEICLTCLYEMLEDRELYLDFVDFGNSSTLVVFSENKTSENPYAFEFLNKYTAEESGLELQEVANGN